MKADIIASYGVSSTKDLVDDQLDQLINQLNNEHKVRQGDIKKEVDPIIRKWRSINLDLMTTLGVYRNSNSWASVNEFLMRPTIAGKELYKLNLEELQLLANKLRAIIKKRQQKLDDEARQAILN